MPAFYRPLSPEQRKAIEDKLKIIPPEQLQDVLDALFRDVFNRIDALEQKEEPK